MLIIEGWSVIPSPLFSTLSINASNPISWILNRALSSEWYQEVIGFLIMYWGQGGTLMVVTQGFWPCCPILPTLSSSVPKYKFGLEMSVTMLAVGKVSPPSCTIWIMFVINWNSFRKESLSIVDSVKSYVKTVHNPMIFWDIQCYFWLQEPFPQPKHTYHHWSFHVLQDLHSSLETPEYNENYFSPQNIENRDVLTRWLSGSPLFRTHLLKTAAAINLTSRCHKS